MAIDTETGAFAPGELPGKLTGEIRRAQRYGRQLAIITLGIRAAPPGPGAGAGAPEGSVTLPALCKSYSARTVLATLLVCSLLVSGGCGWRLQGTARLSPRMAVTYVETGDRYTEFNRALRESLRASGARLTNDRHDATAIVRILKDESGQRVLSVSARNTPEEYEVFYAIEYAVTDTADDRGGGVGVELIAPQSIELTRDYSYDETAVLAKQREQAILREALARDLAGLVVRRLASL